MTQDLRIQLAELQKMSPSQLREKYLHVFGESTRSGNKTFLCKRIAWRLQSNAEPSILKLPHTLSSPPKHNPIIHFGVILVNINEVQAHDYNRRDNFLSIKVLRDKFSTLSRVKYRSRELFVTIRVKRVWNINVENYVENFFGQTHSIGSNDRTVTPVLLLDIWNHFKFGA